MRMIVLCPAALWFLSSLSGHANSQDAEATPPRVAHTSVPKEDPNYALMGEFVGPIAVGDNEYKPLGLQVRPLPNDSFEAIQYQGGLPGQRTFAGEPLKLVGRRSGDLIVLSGGPWAIFVEAESCLVVDRRGNRVGTLERVRRGSPTMGAQPPEGASVLFDGENTDLLNNAQVTPEGLLKEGAEVKPMFQDFNLHVEFRLPYMPNSDGQARGNSGCYLQRRYEVQILDSFGQLPVFNGCSSVYRFKSPDLNMCLPPLQWQTYDIQFTAPRWSSDGSKIRNGRLTVWQNGVKTQDDIELENKTGAGKEEAPSLLPILFQNHSDPVRFRNIWIVDRGLMRGDFPVFKKSPRPKRAKEVVQAKPKKKAAAKDKGKPAKGKPQQHQGQDDAEPSSEPPAAEDAMPAEQQASKALETEEAGEAAPEATQSQPRESEAAAEPSPEQPPRPKPEQPNASETSSASEGPSLK